MALLAAGFDPNFTESYPLVLILALLVAFAA